MKQVAIDVEAEIGRQDVLWGDGHRNTGAMWSLILSEEVGAFAKATLDKNLVQARRYIVQVAAVAMQIANNIDKEIEDHERTGTTTD